MASTVEIGWNIPVTTEADSMKFDVSFTMHDVATKWKDVASFQWEPFGKKNQVPIGTVTGTVHFPNGITGKTSWAWLHTERTSETKRNSDGSYTFTAYNIHNGDYLDVVAAFDAAKAKGIARNSSAGSTSNDSLPELVSCSGLSASCSASRCARGVSGL